MSSNIRKGCGNCGDCHGEDGREDMSTGGSWWVSGGHFWNTP